MCRILIVFTSLWLCLGWLTVNGQNVTTLRGLTVFRAPFVERGPDGKLKGYFVDLLDELALIGKFNYTLDNLNIPSSGPGLYVYTPNDMMISTVTLQNAQFAIADFLVRSSTRYVDFTEPYHVSGLSALVDKSRLTANNISSIEDMLESKQASPTSDKNGTVKEISFGTVRSSSTHRLLAMANDSIGRQVYMRLYNGADLVDTYKEGIKRALKSPFALIQEAINNELATDEHCELTELLLLQNADDGSKQGVLLEYSIAVQKMPKTSLNTFNVAMKKLKSNGKLDELRRRYWNRKCNCSPSE